MGCCAYNQSPCEFYGSKCPIIKAGEDNFENQRIRDKHEADYCFSGNHEDCPTRISLKGLEDIDELDLA